MLELKRSRKRTRFLSMPTHNSIVQRPPIEVYKITSPPVSRCMVHPYLAMLLTSWKTCAISLPSLVLTIGASPMASNSSLSDDEHQPMCTNTFDWTGRVYNSNDCLDALHRLHDTDLKIYRTRELEFLAPGAEPRSNLPAIRTPRRHTVGSCTLVIAMLSTFPPLSLPGQVIRRRPYASTDISRFSYLWSVASWLDDTCIHKGKMLGWVATGRNFDVGVFAWATASDMNRGVGGSHNNRYVNFSQASGMDVTLPLMFGAGGVTGEDLTDS